MGRAQKSCRHRNAAAASTHTTGADRLNSGRRPARQRVGPFARGLACVGERGCNARRSVRHQRHHASAWRRGYCRHAECAQRTTNLMLDAASRASLARRALRYRFRGRTDLRRGPRTLPRAGQPRQRGRNGEHQHRHQGDPAETLARLPQPAHAVRLCPGPRVGLDGAQSRVERVLAVTLPRPRGQRAVSLSAQKPVVIDDILDRRLESKPLPWARPAGAFTPPRGL